MSSDQDFQRIISDYPEEIQTLSLQVRSKIFHILPQTIEVVWERQKIAGYGTGPKKMTEHFSWIQPAKKHVTLGFNYGAELPDPNALLEGTGKMFRHVKVRSQLQLEDQALTDLLTYATSHRVPPAK